MARQNLHANRIKPQTSELLTLRVLRREQISPHFGRVTLGRGDVERFVPMGFDQWFRLFIPVSDGSLARAPQKLNTIALLRYLAVSKTERPALRNYSVRDFREDGPDGPELDVDFVLHGSAAEGTAGPAATWASTCTEDDPVAIIDEGVGFNPPDGLNRVRLVADESGLPAVAGILRSLPADATGEAIIEVPSEEDRQPLSGPDGVEVTWVVRPDHHDVPGRAALAAASALPLPGEPFYGWVVGEQNLPTGLRRHWVSQGVPKNHIMFCGYWRVGRSQ
ncbi:siderophore-interacting protein [Cryptosporangium aurantiacum]|uniref:NADPH-dependent ferric siderophore reductase, contains FAD-binding and SIP domains n=1 Tax=Cryptosporangium aurantiacum TaxID=134849 RepID=A0A1M7Q3X8_9ACTN|nr:siderophore-interacting protein [Cryptosporangium aurantiacum]SHN24820.1 NADPH-dependent ferric siderophore reductase, contains FAD-binding and SIP domains [Cryptosporangium aurantiacum]